MQLHRRTVRRSAEDRKHLLAGHMSEKMSSELGCAFALPGIFLFTEVFMVKEKVTLVPLTADDREQFITEFYNKFNPDPNLPMGDCDDSGPNEMFRFIKIMK